MISKLPGLLLLSVSALVLASAKHQGRVRLSAPHQPSPLSSSSLGNLHNLRAKQAASQLSERHGLRSSADQLPLDVAGTYSQFKNETCHCWPGQRHPCQCSTNGCSFKQQLTFTSPAPDGLIQATLHAEDSSCWSGKMGPFPLSVDAAGRILGGMMWEAPGAQHMVHFDPKKVDQALDFMVMGSVAGFNKGPAGFRHSMITRWNMTVCGTKEFEDGSCTPGTDRYVCFDRFASCTEGPCAEENLEKVSPRQAEYFKPLTTTGLDGKYDIMHDKSSSSCPAIMTIFQFGSQVGLQWGDEDVQMTRILDSSLADLSKGRIQFQTACKGIEMDMGTIISGEIKIHAKQLVLDTYLATSQHDSRILNVTRCAYMAMQKPPSLYKPHGGIGGLAVVLIILLCVSLGAGAGLLACCLTYRRRYVETKISRHYEIFQG